MSERRPRRTPKRRRLVGRQDESALLASHLDRLGAGQGFVAGIEGPQGIGKTALAADLAWLVHERAGHVVWATCTEVDRIRPFGCLLDALDCRLHHPDDARRRVAETMVASAQIDVDPFRFDGDGAWRFPVQDAIVDLLTELTADQPVLVFIDDIHWADDGTLGVALAVARRARSERLGLVWTRPTTREVPVCDQIIARHAASYVNVELGPLSPDDARELVLDLRPGRGVGIGDGQAQPEIDQAGGNPLLLAAAALGGVADAPEHTDGVSRWVATLPAATGDLLAVAAVAGGVFDLSTLADVTGRDTTDLADALRPAVRAGLLSDVGGRFQFVHDLVRRSAVDDLPASLRQALHRELASALTARGADPSRVAHHLAQGARAGDEAAAAAIRAACKSIVRHSAASAADLLGRAVELCRPGSSAWATAVIDRVIALQWAGRPSDALALASEAVSRPMAAGDLARLRHARAASLALVNDLPNAVAELRSLLEDQRLDDAARATILAELATLGAWGVDRAEARERVGEAVATARRSGALKAELKALCARCTLEMFDGDVTQAVATAREAVARGRDFSGTTPAKELYLGLALANADAVDEAEIWFRGGQAAAEAVYDPWLVSRYQLARMSGLLHTGDWSTVILDAESVIALHEETGLGSGMPQAPASAGIVAIRRGAPPDQVARYRRLASAHATAGAEPGGLLYVGWLEALIAEHQGRTSDAVALLEQMMAGVASTAPLIQLWLAPDLVRMLLAGGAAARADLVVRDVTVFAHRVGVRSAIEVARLCSGLIAASGDEPSAVAILNEVADGLAECGRRPAELAALDALDALGVDDLRERRDRRRTELGIITADLSSGRRAPTSAGQPRLTPTERTVAALVVSGLTNAAIGARLGVSKRTVEYHVSNLYLKLGVATRVALANVARALVVPAD